MKRASFLLGLALLLILGAMALKGQLATAPGLRTETPPGAFDTARAVARLKRILGEERPHPVDSAANDAVRARLVAELYALGLRPRLTDDLVCNGSAKARSIACARVRNVVASLGPATGKHVLMVSHYDSTPAGPGAADDGIGVAVMLETAAQLSGRKLARPVSFLFNEGEEIGLLGARAFLNSDPLAARISHAVNLEARGVTGPALMFETSRPNAAPVELYRRTAERPAANSLSTDFYKMVPNSTDVAVFEERPWAILNFAIIGNETRYHSPGDTLAALEPRSVQHMGDQALAAMLALAAGKAPEARSERLFADLLGRSLIVLPVELGIALMALLLLVTAFFAWNRRGGMSRGAAAVVAAMAAAAALAFLGQLLIGLFRPGDYWRGHPDIIAAAVDTTALAAALAAILFIARPIAADRLRVAFWLVYLILGAVMSSVAPGGAIFFLFPPLLVCTGLVASRWFPTAERIAGIAATFLLFVQLAPVLHLMQVLLDFSAAWTFAPLAAIIILPALIELRALLAPPLQRPALAVAAVLALAAWAATALAPAYTEDRKQRFAIEHVRGANGKWRWMISNDGAPLPGALAAHDFKSGTKVPYSTRSRWSAAAPAAPISEPRIEKIAERQVRGRRILRLRIRANGAERIVLKAPPQAAFRSVALASRIRAFGKGKQKDDYFLSCVGRSCDGMILDLQLESRKPVEAMLIGSRSGLIPAARPLLAGRPAHAAPQYGADSTITLRKLRL